MSKEETRSSLQLKPSKPRASALGKSLLVSMDTLRSRVLSPSLPIVAAPTAQAHARPACTAAAPTAQAPTAARCRRAALLGRVWCRTTLWSSPARCSAHAHGSRSMRAGRSSRALRLVGIGRVAVGRSSCVAAVRARTRPLVGARSRGRWTPAWRSHSHARTLARSSHSHTRTPARSSHGWTSERSSHARMPVWSSLSPGLARRSRRHAAPPHNIAR